MKRRNVRRGCHTISMIVKGHSGASQTGTNIEYSRLELAFLQRSPFSYVALSPFLLLFYTSSLWSALYYNGASVTMASTTSLPPLDPLYKANAKRTYSVFASCPEQGMKEEEKRYVKQALWIVQTCPNNYSTFVVHDYGSP